MEDLLGVKAKTESYGPNIELVFKFLKKVFPLLSYFKRDENNCPSSSKVLS